MSVFLRNVILDIYTYLCNVFAYFENFMRYIIYKMHILYNNVCKRARVAWARGSRSDIVLTDSDIASLRQ